METTILGLGFRLKFRHMSYSLNSLMGVIEGILWGSSIVFFFLRGY